MEDRKRKCDSRIPKKKRKERKKERRENKTQKAVNGDGRRARQRQAEED